MSFGALSPKPQQHKSFTPRERKLINAKDEKKSEGKKPLFLPKLNLGLASKK